MTNNRAGLFLHAALTGWFVVGCQNAASPGDDPLLFEVVVQDLLSDATIWRPLHIDPHPLLADPDLMDAHRRSRASVPEAVVRQHRVVPQTNLPEFRDARTVRVPATEFNGHAAVTRVYDVATRRQADGWGVVKKVLITYIE